MIQTALKRDDSELLHFILELADEYTGKVDEAATQNEHESGTTKTIPSAHIGSALQLAKPQVLAEYIKRTAAGVSIDELAVAHGANETTEKPKYYQGLNVHGKKCNDWAAAGRNVSGLKDKNPWLSPLLLVAHMGSLEEVEWFLSDTPLRCYKQYAQAHQDDKRLQKLSQV